MVVARARRIAAGALLLVATLAVSGCYYGPAPYYAYPRYSYPRYAYRPSPYWGGGYGYHYWR